MLQYLAYKIGLFIIHCVPRNWAYAFARWVCEQQYHRSRKDREAVIRNLRQITGSDEGLEEKARQVFHNFGVYLVDFFLMYKTVSESFVKDRIVIHGREHLEKAKARGKGVIVLTAHIGNWEMGAAVMARLGYPVMAIALPHKERRVNELFNRQRQNYGVTVIPTNTAVRRCVQALKHNGAVALLGDRDFGTFGEPLPFLGRMTLIPKGAAFFAMKTGAAILPGFVVPSQDGKYEMFFEDLVLPPEGEVEDPQAVMTEMMKKCIVPIEQKIRAYPTHWLMFREFGIEHENLRSHSHLQ